MYVCMYVLQRHCYKSVYVATNLIPCCSNPYMFTAPACAGSLVTQNWNQVASTNGQYMHHVHAAHMCVIYVYTHTVPGADHPKTQNQYVTFSKWAHIQMYIGIDIM